MTFAEIEKLLEKGFTPEQITQMSQTGAQTGAQTETQTETPAPGTEQDKDSTPSWAATLNESIQSLKRTMQAAALAGSSQAAPVSTEDAASAALASIIAPTFKKEDK